MLQLTAESHAAWTVFLGLLVVLTARAHRDEAPRASRVVALLGLGIAGAAGAILAWY